MFINLSNHPVEGWSERQKSYTENMFGRIINLPFPSIDPAAQLDEVKIIAVNYLEEIGKIREENPAERVAILLTGEMTFIFNLAILLKRENIKTVASTTKRDVLMDDAGNKIVKFQFVGYRDYF